MQETEISSTKQFLGWIMVYGNNHDVWVYFSMLNAGLTGNWKTQVMRFITDFRTPRQIRKGARKPDSTCLSLAVLTFIKYFSYALIVIFTLLIIVISVDASTDFYYSPIFKDNCKGIFFGKYYGFFYYIQRTER